MAAPRPKPRHRSLSTSLAGRRAPFDPPRGAPLPARTSVEDATAIVAAAVAVVLTACRVAPEPLPPWPVDDGPLIAGAWKPADPASERRSDDSLPAELASLDAGRWAAEVRPADAERLPDVTVTLNERLGEGMSAGTAAYDFGAYACRYTLHVESVEERSVRLRQRREEGPCGAAGRIHLSWDEAGGLVGDWRRPEGNRWFRARLARLELEEPAPGS